MLNLLKGWYEKHFSTPGTVEFALVLLVAFLVVYYFMWLVGPLVVALCIAYCLDWFVRFGCRKLKFSRTLASVLTMVLFVGLSVGVLVFVAPRVVHQGNQFYTTMQNFMLPENQQVDDDFDSVVASRTYSFVKSLPEPLSSMFTEEEIKGYVSQLRSTVIANTSDIIKNQVMPSVVNVMSWLMYLIIVPIFTLLMLMDKERLKKRFSTYILPDNKSVLNTFWPKINAQIEGYIRGKVLHVIIITMVNTVAFLLLGLNYAFLLGFGVGLSVVIPYVGAVIITIPVVLVSVFQFGFGTYLLSILAVYLIIQLLDSNVLTPMLFSKATNLDAFSILAAIFIFGGLWGFWGVFFSIPLATFIRTIFIYWPSRGKFDRDEVFKIENKKPQ
jgi:putative permease